MGCSKSGPAVSVGKHLDGFGSPLTWGKLKVLRFTVKVLAPIVTDISRRELLSMLEGAYDKAQRNKDARLKSDRLNGRGGPGLRVVHSDSEDWAPPPVSQAPA